MRFVLYTLLWLLPFLSAGQAALKKLPPNINHPSINVSAPYISLDGNSLLFVSDNAEDNALAIFYTAKADAVNWKDPVLLPRHINHKLNFLKGFALNQTGTQMFLTNMKAGGLGGFDLYSTELRGTFWPEPVNLGAPINSSSHEACPSLSADGTQLFFMRCEKMDFAKAERCKIMVAKRKPNGMWDTPAELPPHINTGNSQTPRIMGDSETLIFSSDRLPQGQGGLDLYRTRWNGTTWSAPEALAFANTPGDDQYVSATSLGRYLLKEAPGKFNTEIVEMLFPANLKPKATTKIEGRITGPANPASPYLAVFNLKDQSRVFSGRPARDGTFTLYLNEGAVYDLSVEPEQDNYTFYSRQFNLTGERIATMEKVNIALKPLAAGDAVELSGVSFLPYRAELTPGSQQELRRAVRLMKANSHLAFDVEVALAGYQRDSVQRDADLTEVLTDTLKKVITYTEPDSTAVEGFRTLQRDSIWVKHTYHNDRTPQQVLEVVNYLVGQGVAASSVRPMHQAVPEPVAENRKIRVTIRAR
jgi:hypothetical protein